MARFLLDMRLWKVWPHFPSQLQRLLQARLFVGAGVDKVRLTGGEPTLRKDLPEIVGSLSELPGLRAIGLTTNGVALERKLPLLKANGERSMAEGQVGNGVLAPGADR